MLKYFWSWLWFSSDLKTLKSEVWIFTSRYYVPAVLSDYPFKKSPKFVINFLLTPLCRYNFLKIKNPWEISFKRQCHEIFGNFLFHESKPSGPLINRLKWFCVSFVFGKIFAKNSTLCRLTLGGVEIEMFANPKLANTARSWTLRRLSLRIVKQMFYFRKSPFPWNLGSIWYFEKFRIFFENPKVTNTAARSQQLNFSKIHKCGNTARSFAGNKFVFSGLSLP